MYKKKYVKKWYKKKLKKTFLQKKKWILILPLKKKYNYNIWKEKNIKNKLKKNFNKIKKKKIIYQTNINFLLKYLYKYLVINTNIWPTNKKSNILFYKNLSKDWCYYNLFNNFFHQTRYIQKKIYPKYNYLKNNIIKFFILENILKSENYLTKEFLIDKKFLKLPLFIIGFYKSIPEQEYKLPINLTQYTKEKQFLNILKNLFKLF